MWNASHLELEIILEIIQIYFKLPWVPKFDLKHWINILNILVVQLWCSLFPHFTFSFIRSIGPTAESIDWDKPFFQLGSEISVLKCQVLTCLKALSLRIYLHTRQNILRKIDYFYWISSMSMEVWNYSPKRTHCASDFKKCKSVVSFGKLKRSCLKIILLELLAIVLRRYIYLHCFCLSRSHDYLFHENVQFTPFTR